MVTGGLAWPIAALRVGSLRSLEAPWTPDRAKATLISGVPASPNRSAGGPCHIGRLEALLADHHVKLHGLSVTQATQKFSWVVSSNSAMMYKNIQVVITAADETVAVSHVEP